MTAADALCVKLMKVTVIALVWLLRIICCEMSSLLREAVLQQTGIFQWAQTT
jgi:hypothetical protein